MRGQHPHTPVLPSGSDEAAELAKRRSQPLVRSGAAAAQASPLAQRLAQPPVRIVRPAQSPAAHRPAAPQAAGPMPAAVAVPHAAPAQRPPRIAAGQVGAVPSAVPRSPTPAPAPEPASSSPLAARMNRVIGTNGGVAAATAADVAAAAAATREARKSKRKSTRLAGLIQVGRGRPDVDCSVRDISGTGALISLAPAGGRRNVFDKKADVPDRFTLTIKADRMRVECEVVRRRGEELGVKFMTAPKIV